LVSKIIASGGESLFSVAGHRVRALIGMSHVAGSRQVKIHQDQIVSLAGSHRAPAPGCSDCALKLPLLFIVRDDNDAARPVAEPPFLLDCMRCVAACTRNISRIAAKAGIFVRGGSRYQHTVRAYSVAITAR